MAAADVLRAPATRRDYDFSLSRAIRPKPWNASVVLCELFHVAETENANGPERERRHVFNVERPVCVIFYSARY